MTDTPAHTPLPWHVVEYDAGDCAHYDHNGPCPGIFPDDKYDTCVIHWDGFKQQYWSSANGDQRQIKANAAFIVRACNSHYSLVETIKACREQFDFYAAEHRKAEKHEKAATNERFAFLCSEALSQAGGAGEA